MSSFNRLSQKLLGPLHIFPEAINKLTSRLFFLFFVVGTEYLGTNSICLYFDGQVIPIPRTISIDPYVLTSIHTSNLRVLYTILQYIRSVCFEFLHIFLVIEINCQRDPSSLVGYSLGNLYLMNISPLTYQDYKEIGNEQIIPIIYEKYLMQII